jgi:zinc/manganese transport system ATP-binding protein
MTGIQTRAAALHFDDVTLGYDRHPAVHHLQGSVAEGSLLAVVGPNGLDRRSIAYLPQAADLDRSFPLSVFDLVAAGDWQRTGLFGGFGKDQKRRVHEAMQAVGLAGFENRGIGTLSGGQMQRALFARLLLQDARLILLDEPFTAIDSKTTSDLLALIARWHGEHRTVITVLHDMELVKAHFPESLLLARETVAWGATGETLRSENLLRARRMIEAHDPHAETCARAA